MPILDMYVYKHYHTVDSATYSTDMHSLMFLPIFPFSHLHSVLCCG